jgi:hypothetical protein
MIYNYLYYLSLFFIALNDKILIMDVYKVCDVFHDLINQEATEVF